MTALRHVLLLVQSVAGGLVALEALVLGAAGHSPLLALIGLLAAALATVPVAVAAGLLAGWRWARPVGIGYELLLLICGVANGLVLGNDDLVSVLFTGVLPAALLWLLLRSQPRMGRWSGAASRAGSTGS